MLNVLNNFDPISFLKIDVSGLTSSQEASELRETLNKQISEYLMLKVSQSLTVQQQEEIAGQTDSTRLIELLSIYVPNLEERIQQELEQFKTEFSNIP